MATAVGTRRQSRVWVLLWWSTALLEACVAAYCLARLVLGPVSLSRRPHFWLAWLGVALLLYLAATLGLASPRSTERLPRTWRPWALTLPFLAGFALQLAALQFAPSGGAWAWGLFSTIEPFPTLGAGLFLMVLFLLKLLLAVGLLRGKSIAQAHLCEGSAKVAIPGALLLLGIMQVSVYLVPLGNLYYRSWAVADALALRLPYPVTATEPQSIMAGSPPYIYDLPLVPVMLLISFTLVGHNALAAHLPAVLASALFPLCLYLMVREATASRITALLFATLLSLFPFLRFWVLNLPDPDPLLLTSLCLAGYLYLRAVAGSSQLWPWVLAGAAAGLACLARPEGVLYAGCLALGVLARRPGFGRIGLFFLSMGVLVFPAVFLWMTNFGFLWPQNYNRTLRLDYSISNYEILRAADALGFYQRALGVEGVWTAVLLLAIAGAIAAGVLGMIKGNRLLLALAVPGIGNFVAVFFTSPNVTNPSHFADFFRHISFGLPFLTVTAAYGLHAVSRALAASRVGRLATLLGVLILVASIAVEGDLLANPTATHRPGANQVLVTGTYLSLESLVEHPMPLPYMDYHLEGQLTVAYPTSLLWPEAVAKFYESLDMSFDSRGRPFGYASVSLFLIAFCYALLANWTSGKAQLESWMGRIR